MDELATRYLQLLPYFLIAFILAFLLTPWIGRLAYRIGAIDLPSAKRAKFDKTKERRVHRHSPALLGGLGMMIALLSTLIILGAISNFRWGVIAGLIVVIVYGFLDDMYELKAIHTFGFQILAASLVVISGITVSSIQVAGIFIDFNLFSQPIYIGEFIYNFIFPADLLTIFWIVGLMNVMNWVGGVDGLNGSVSAVISIAMLLISMKLGILAPALFLAAHAGSLLGVLPYNYHVSKLFYGSIGDFGNGYILAVMSILAGTKLPLFLVIMGLPFFDALIVFFGRLSRNRSYIFQPWKILSVNDKTHFHHRLLELGLSHKGVMFIETGITIGLAAVGLLLSDFRFDFVALLSTAAIIIICISLISILQRRKNARTVALAETIERSKPRVNIEIIDRDDESDPYRY
jgi:UDP-GlcNAc:undecaprenyl-phosphate GlcNAc-1-phosphate transferase